MVLLPILIYFLAGKKTSKNDGMSLSLSFTLLSLFLSFSLSSPPCLSLSLSDDLEESDGDDTDFDSIEHRRHHRRRHRPRGANVPQWANYLCCLWLVLALMVAAWWITDIILFATHEILPKHWIPCPA